MGKKQLITLVIIIFVVASVFSLFQYKQESLLGKAPSNSHSSDPSTSSIEANLTTVNYDDSKTLELKKELEINPNNFTTLRELTSLMWEKLSSYENPPSNLVLDLLDNLLKLNSADSNDAKTLLMLANLSFNQKVFSKSASYYEKYLFLNPDDLEARSSYSSVLTFIGKFDDSLKQIDMVLKKNPNSFQANAYKAITLSQIGKIQESKELAVKALSFAPNDEAKARFSKFIDSLESELSGNKILNSNSNIIEFVKTNPIAGQKFIHSEITSDKKLKLFFKDFPMDKMPPIAKETFFGKLKESSDIKNYLQIEFIDSESGSIMEVLK